MKLRHIPFLFTIGLIPLAVCADTYTLDPREYVNWGKGQCTAPYDNIVQVITTGLCTGQYVAPNIIMTALHCVASGPAGAEETIETATIYDCNGNRFTATLKAHGDLGAYNRETSSQQYDWALLLIENSQYYHTSHFDIPSDTKSNGNLTGSIAGFGMLQILSDQVIQSLKQQISDWVKENPQYDFSVYGVDKDFVTKYPQHSDLRHEESPHLAMITGIDALKPYISDGNRLKVQENCRLAPLNKTKGYRPSNCVAWGGNSGGAFYTKTPADVYGVASTGLYALPDDNDENTQFCPTQNAYTALQDLIRQNPPLKKCNQCKTTTTANCSVQPTFDDCIYTTSCRAGYFNLTGDGTNALSCTKCGKNSSTKNENKDTTCTCNPGYSATGGADRTNTSTNGCNPITYTVKFDANGGTGTMTEQTHTYDTDRNLTQNAFTNGERPFVGWATTSSGDVKYTNGQNVKNITKTAGDTVTLYAIWGQTLDDCTECSPTFANCEISIDKDRCVYTTSCQDGYGHIQNNGKHNPICTPNQYTIKYHTVHGTGEMLPSTHEYNTPSKLTPNAFTYRTNTFLGWSTDPNTTTVQYTDSAEIKNLTSQDGAVINLYAVWDNIDPEPKTPAVDPEQLDKLGQAITDKLQNIDNLTDQEFLILLDAIARYKHLAELREKYEQAKARENSLPNKLLGGLSMAATGAGGAMLAAAMSAQAADAAAERDMAAYLATFTCDYGAGRNIRGGETNIQLPGGNELIEYVSEYKQLAASLKEAKAALGMLPGIESEVVFDSATTGLYDNVSIGTQPGAFTSLSRALMDPTGEDAAKWAAQKESTAKVKNIGLGVGVGGAGAGLVGNIAINDVFKKDKTSDTKTDTATNNTTE